jgi:hypothetical protein
MAHRCQTPASERWRWIPEGETLKRGTALVLAWDEKPVYEGMYRAYLAYALVPRPDSLLDVQEVSMWARAYEAHGKGTVILLDEHGKEMPNGPC